MHTPRWRPENVNEFIPIVMTATAFGGSRHWFSCPSCGRRCRLIYGGLRFRCRLCWHALYESQYESEPMRISAMRWRIRQKVEERGGQEWPFSLDGPFPPKPPRMHWRTYRRLKARDEELSGRWDVGIGSWLRRTDPQRPRCGAPTRKGLPCAQRAMLNGRCAVHGGAQGERKP